MRFELSKIGICQRSILVDMLGGAILTECRRDNKPDKIYHLVQDGRHRKQKGPLVSRLLQRNLFHAEHDWNKLETAYTIREDAKKELAEIGITRQYTLEEIKALRTVLY